VTAFVVANHFSDKVLLPSEPDICFDACT